MGVRESPEGASECGACCQQVTRQSVSEAVSAPQGRKGQKEMQAPQFSLEASLSLMGTLSYPIVCLPKTCPFPSAPSGHSCASPQGPLISPFPPPNPPPQSAPLSRNGFPTHFPLRLGNFTSLYLRVCMGFPAAHYAVPRQCMDLLVQLPAPSQRTSAH